MSAAPPRRAGVVEGWAECWSSGQAHMQGCELSVQGRKDGHRLTQRGHDVLQPAEVLAAQQRHCVRKLREHAGRARARARARIRSGPGEQAEARLELSGGSQHAFASSLLRPPALRDA